MKEVGLNLENKQQVLEFYENHMFNQKQEEAHSLASSHYTANFKQKSMAVTDSSTSNPLFR